MNFQTFLVAVNDVLMAGVSATAFAVLLYLFFYNRESRVAMVFNGLLTCVLIVYVTDLLLININNPTRALLLLRLQWLGIAFTPTLYLLFARAIRLSVFENHSPRWLYRASFTGSTLIALLALFSDGVAYDGVFTQGVTHLRPGPLFYPFALYFGATTLWALWMSRLVRRRSYTRAARRRMTYLSVGMLAPAAGVFPYLLVIGWPAKLPGALLWILLILGNVAIGVMLVLMAYSVAFIDTLSPDRIIKHRLVRFLLRGPATAIVALSCFGGGLLLEQALGLGRYTLSLVALVLTFILGQLAVELGKPILDLALYREGRTEVAQIQELSQRLLTTTDTRQFLENLLAMICELLHSHGGLLAMLEDGQMRGDVWCGLRIPAEIFSAWPPQEEHPVQRQHGFLVWNDYWIAPLHDRTEQTLLGLLALHSPAIPLPLAPQQQQALDQALQQARAALEDRRLQQLVLAMFTSLLPAMDSRQRQRAALRNPANVPADTPELPQWIHDALAHYWGGPRLTENPLLNWQIVQRAAADLDGNSIKGLRAVLAEAIEQLRPDGERKLTAPEWLLYNILEMKFLRGQKVRAVAMRLALSESDFYRKQRVAIENLAAILLAMETEAQETIL